MRALSALRSQHAVGTPFYDAAYGTFGAEAAAAIRAGAYDHDIGQNSWLTVDEYRTFWGWLGLTAASSVLDIGSGSGGPALFLADEMGCRVTGVEVHSDGVAAGNEAAHARGLEQRARFLCADARQPLPLVDNAFDAILCIDAVNHLYERRGVFNEWHRVLRPGGAVVLTDPLTLTGMVRADEVGVRTGGLGEQVFTAPGVNERLLADGGFAMVRVEDRTSNMAAVAAARRRARTKHAAVVSQLESADVSAAYDPYLKMVERLAREHRVARLAYLAHREIDARPHAARAVRFRG